MRGDDHRITIRLPSNGNAVDGGKIPRLTANPTRLIESGGGMSHLRPHEVNPINSGWSGGRWVGGSLLESRGTATQHILARALRRKNGIAKVPFICGSVLLWNPTEAP